VRLGDTRLNGSPIDGTVTNRPNTLSLLSLTTTGPVPADSFSREGSTTRPWWGDLAELIIFDRVLSEAERLDVEEYLANKYALYVPKPPIQPNGGPASAASPVTVTIDVPAGSEVYYTTDGTTPTEASMLYMEPFQVSSSLTVQAQAFVAGRAPSAVSVATFVDAAAFNPATLTGLKLWAYAGGTNTVHEAARVSRVADQSGQGNHLTQAAPLRQPALVFGMTGAPVFRFDGSDDFFAFTTRLTTIRTVFWVLRESPSATADYRYLLGDVSSYAFATGTGHQIWGGWAHARVTGGQTRLNGALVNGTSTLLPTTLSILSLVTTDTAEADSLARYSTSAQRPWWGDVAEIVIYDRALSDSERLLVEQYLAARHGVTLQ
jgi:hypothetical protein